MAKVIRGRPSRADTLRQNDAADRWYAALAGVEPRAQSGVGPKRERAARQPSGNVLEKDVLAAVREALRAHPKVASCWRIVAGDFAAEGAPHVITAPKGFPDLCGMLTDGRFYGCEVKSPTGRVAPHQAEFLATIRANNGVAFVARCADDVRQNLG
jgi:hypothetical protein